MRYIGVKYLLPEQILGKSIFASDGRILLKEGVVLSTTLINQLDKLGISAVYIKDERFEDIQTDDIISEETKRDTIKVLSESIKRVQSGKSFDMKEVNKTTEQIIAEVLRNKDILINLNEIRTKDNNLFIHSINVCIMSIILGVRLKLSSKQLIELATGALFHDIGKVISDNELDKHIITKPEINEHTWRGYYYLKTKPEIGILTAHIALQHHERFDGSGFPRGINEKQIHIYSKIVGITNYYDNLVSTHDNGKSLMPYEACEEIMAMANIYFDHYIVWEFLRTIAAYPNGATVRLSTNEIGVVVDQHKGLPARPIVRVYSKGFQDDLKEVEIREVDLATQITIFIDEVLND